MTTTPPGRSVILAEALPAITVDRAATHGKAEDSFTLIAAYWSAHLGHPVSAIDVAAMMTLFKLARIKGNPKTRNTLVAMVTARGQVSDSDEAKRRGADAYFIKPFSPMQVAGWIRDQLES